ncbi:uncharacterized protein BP01DRAFT_188624 [Aspergillus saccharolyticus JOP 1030-1]|uniref:Uncharacterized protein n=1 Tax=Aspergillus saccharolyticus JOP 1030-1 TaxID=1450539 RepID=A0A318Z3W8_9EURO|nr:hypothetical protein BP01DRAFT_188624 [Aspergillus saccharolyticus JOP 1030-1]PYH41017.1 hypothetical protein BP01DRAFT_188624 [Aspergillus saccharolyticus JOP 1030-1]
MCPCLVLPQSLREWLQLLMLLYATFIILFHWRRGPPRQTPHPPGPEEPEESPPPAPSDTDSESPSDSETSPIAAFPIQRLPYHEPTITTLITQIYHLYLQLDYIQPHELIYPPPETGHAINEALCAALGLAPAVISLMKRLPYFQTSSLAHDIPFTPRSQAFVYLEDEEIRGGRDPEWYGTRAPDPGFLLPWELALTFATDEGVHWILDTRESTFPNPSPFLTQHRIFNWIGLGLTSHARYTPRLGSE